MRLDIEIKTNLSLVRTFAGRAGLIKSLDSIPKYVCPFFALKSGVKV